MGGGNYRQKKSSSSSGFFSIFNIFAANNNKGRGGRYYDEYDYGTNSKVYPSDYDKGNWGVAEPGIDMKAEAFIRQYKQRVSESERHQLNPAAQNA